MLTESKEVKTKIEKIEKITEAKNWFYEKIRKIDTSLA